MADEMKKRIPDDMSRDESNVRMNPAELHRHQTLLLTQFSILLAIEAIVCFTPLGSLPIGPLVATLSHIPVIITAVNLGVGAGSAMGFFFGLFSFIVMTFMPGASAASAFVFTPAYAPGNGWSLVICFVPRILIGTVSGLVFKFLHRFSNKGRVWDILSYAITGALGSLTNTVLVLGGIYIFFGEPYAEAFGLAYEALIGAIMGVVGTNGMLELALAVVCTYVICKPIRKFILRSEPSYKNKPSAESETTDN